MALGGRGAQPGPELPFAAGQPRHDRADGDGERLRDLAVGHFGQVKELQRFAVGRLDLLQGIQDGPRIQRPGRGFSIPADRRRWRRSVDGRLMLAGLEGHLRMAASATERRSGS